VINALRAHMAEVGIVARKDAKGQHRANEASKRLQIIRGIGIIGRRAIAATVTNQKAFRPVRDFAALPGLGSYRNKIRLAASRNLDRLETGRPLSAAYSCVVGAHSVLPRAKQNLEKHPVDWDRSATGPAAPKGRRHGRTRTFR
jgi:hypothetical protein